MMESMPVLESALQSDSKGLKGIRAQQHANV